MNNRLQLQRIFEELLGSRNVYFQPPSDVHMKYPCIVYNKETFDQTYADDFMHVAIPKYRVTYIDEDPESDMVSKLLSRFEMIRHANTFISDNLNHDVFDLYF